MRISVTSFFHLTYSKAAIQYYTVYYAMLLISMHDGMMHLHNYNVHAYQFSTYR